MPNSHAVVVDPGHPRFGEVGEIDPKGSGLGLVHLVFPDGTGADLCGELPADDDRIIQVWGLTKPDGVSAFAAGFLERHKLTLSNLTEDARNTGLGRAFRKTSKDCFTSIIKKVFSDG